MIWWNNLKIRNRFLSKINYNNTNGCWEWSDKLCNNYPRFKYNRITKKSHRLSYEIFVGPLNEQLFIDHLCRNTKCVNPFHLELVTPKVNNERGFSPTNIANKTNKCKLGHELSQLPTQKRCIICMKDYEKKWYKSRKMKSK